MLKKIPYIKQFGSFTDFEWDSTVKDDKGNIVDFSKLNIIYGRNYSGKTTLSRIIRSIKKQELHEDYQNSCFLIDDDLCGNITQDTLENFNTKIRVYNSDFVKDNLKFLQDKRQNIKPFAIIGEENINIIEELETIQNELGDDSHGLKMQMKINLSAQESNKSEYEQATYAINEMLRKQAQKIKNESTKYKFPTYTISHIKNDIDTIVNNNFTYLLDDRERSKNEQIVSEVAKQEIPKVSIPHSQYSTIALKVSEALGKELKPSASINELLTNPELQQWVYQGIHFHKRKRDNCAFCGGNISQKLWERLDLHFSSEFEQHRNTINNIILSIADETESFKMPPEHYSSSFYYEDLYNCYKQQYSALKNEIYYYKNKLSTMTNILNEKIKNIFSATHIQLPAYDSKGLTTALEKLNNTIKTNNSITVDLDNKKNISRKLLRLHEVQTFLKNINYLSLKEKETLLATKYLNSQTITQQLQGEINNKLEIYDKLLSKINDERKGAEKINKYLKHYFGHNAITLEVDKDENGSKFVLKRGKNIATNLSEGECSLVAFCYFMAKLHDLGTNISNTIIWIDDPISSLDSNHVFFIFSIIENALMKPKRYQQLFISTHSLDFLKYLKRATLSGKKDKYTRYFLMENNGFCSKLLPMPKYLQTYITEFNYLFHTIFTHANSEHGNTDVNHAYSFGNNLRKFLEAYLFYKYPNNDSFKTKLNIFFNDDHDATILINRVIQEYSHLEEIFDRSITPIDVPEMKKIAQYVLSKIKANDPSQYAALLKSIGAPDEEPIAAV